MKTKLPFIAALLFALFTASLSQAQITITFLIDMTGQSIGSGGVHLAGTFASDACQEITTDWDPGAAGSQLSVLKGNTYIINLTFPSASAGLPLTFLVVRNNIWNDNYQ